MELLKELLNEDFSDTKKSSGYYDTFIPANIVWLDGILHYLRYEEPFKSSPKSKEFADNVEKFFDSRFGNMVYHVKDDKLIGSIIDKNWKALEENPTVDQVKEQIKLTNRALFALKKKDIIAPEGSHPEETDFWVDQRDKEMALNIS